ncbi:TPA: DNA-directed RNA polymerase [Aeromonas hydrophila]
MTDLYYVQIAREERCQREARSRLQKQMEKMAQDGRHSQRPPEHHLIQHSLDLIFNEVEKRISYWRDASREGKPSKDADTYSKLSKLTKENLHLFLAEALSDCIDFSMARKTRCNLMMKIGTRLSHVLLLQELQVNHAKEYKKAIKRMRQKGEERKRIDTLSFISKIAGVDQSLETKQLEGNVGLRVMTLIKEVTKYFYEEKIDVKHNKTEVFMRINNTVDAWIADGIKHQLDIAYYNTPMIVPPTNWGNGLVIGGGYLSTAQLPIPFVKVATRSYLESLDERKDPRLATVFDAVNYAQDTGWRINKRIMNIIKYALDAGISIGSLPELLAHTKTPKPRYSDEAAEILKKWHEAKKNNEAFKNREVWIATLLKSQRRWVNGHLEWRQREELRHKNNHAYAAEWMEVSRNLATAKELSVYPSCYMPHQVDFRGRVYAVTQGGINPQGPDYIKAMLQFDVGMELGERGWYWLRWHTANVWGEDKAAHEDRVKWTDEHLAMIRMVASDPLQYRNWEHADKPFQFLACCFEIYEAMQTEGGPVKFQSRMPIALDGSCSGLQHLGMATRCETTGRAVNLLAGDKPSDIYQIVADKVAVDLEKIVLEKNDRKKDELQVQAAKWISWSAAWKNGRLSRSITKRSVMTYPYGSAEYGFGKQLLADILEPAYEEAQKNAYTLGKAVKDVFPWADEAELNTAARFLARLIYKAVVETVVIPAQVMAELKKLASLINKAGTDVWWTTPLGFRVEQRYRNKKTGRLDSVVKGLSFYDPTYGEDGEAPRVQVSFKYNSDKLDKNKQRDAIAPNVVHSLDATHLMMTVYAAHAQGIKHFALIHDSFATHAANTDQMFRIVREQMVELYKADPLGQIIDDLKGQIMKDDLKKLPKPHSKGQLNIEEILESQYAFA